MKSLLMAISNNELSGLVREFLQENGFQVVTASSLEESVELVKSYHLDGIVMTTDWAIEETGSGNVTLMGLAKDKIPTVTIIKKNSYDILDVVYPSAMHQFVTTPFGSDELLGRFERAMENKRLKDDGV